MTIYYLDSDNGDDGTGDGSSGNPWKTLDKFTETARNAGDICRLRRGMTANYDDGTDLAFSSSGDIENPIVIEADYDDVFNDHVNLSVTATATLTFGSKVITFASDISGVCAAGDVIYVTAEDAREFAYEVDSVSTVTVTLFLPYKGAEAGSGKAMTNMQSMPKWNTAAGADRISLNNDLNWMFQGLHLRGTSPSGIFELNSAQTSVFRDCVFEGNGASDIGVRFVDDWLAASFVQCRFVNYATGIASVEGTGGFIGEARDCLFDGNSAASSVGTTINTGSAGRFVDCEFKNHSRGDIEFTSGVSSSGRVALRNCILASGVEVHDIHQSRYGQALVEDHDGEPGDTRQLTYLSDAQATPVIQSEAGTVRSGGSNIAIKATPSTKFANVQGWVHSRQLLFEHAFYATTDSKQYDVYFRPTATADWTADPTNTELWIEIEYWGHASNNFRRIVKSTGVIDMNGSTNWAALSVTVAPAQAGVLYLRAYYAKTKEGGKDNTFFCDPIPVVT